MILRRTYTLRNKIESNPKETEKSSKSLNKDKIVKNKKNIPKKLANFITSDEKMKFISKNKLALKEYETFLNRTKKKNNKVTFGSTNKNIEYQNQMAIFKDNPKLIISSYKSKFYNRNKKIKYQNNILGVDEGLITLPKIDLEEVQNRYIMQEKDFKTEENKNDKNENNKNDNLSNIYINTEIKMNKNINSDKNIENNNNLVNKRIKSVDSKRIKASYLDRGEEVINKLLKFRKRNNNEDSKIYNEQKTITNYQNYHKFKYEIRRLNKWDFNNISSEKPLNSERVNSNKKIKNILSEIKQSQRMNWITEIKTNKEQFKLICRNKHLKEFINKINEEQNAIYMKNIKIFNKGFNFNIFSKNTENYNLENEKEKEEKYYMEKNSDTYHEIIKEKIKLEENLAKELTHSAEAVFILKNKIENEKQKIFKLTDNMMKIKNKEYKLNQEYDEEIKRLDLYLQQLDNTIALKNSENKNSNEYKKNVNYSENHSKLTKIPKNNEKNANSNYGNFNCKRLSIIHSEDLTKIRTLSNKNIKNIKILKIKGKDNKNNKINTSKSQNEELKESKDEELLIKKKLLTEKTTLDKKHKEEISGIKIEKDELKNEINKINSKIDELIKKLRKSKNSLNKHIQTLSDYYYQILKKGIDVRRTGLSWAVVKLMELNAFIDHHHFPNFLDPHQINYLMRTGVKIYEVKELIKLFQLFKQKEKIIKEEYYNEDRNREKEEKTEKLNKIKKLNNNKIGNNYAEFLEDIQQKYDNMINFNINEEIEEKNINKTSEYLKEIIMNNRKLGMYFIPGSLAEYFSKDQKFREYFDDAYYLKEEINKREKDIQNERDKELKYYRNKFKINYFEEKHKQEYIATIIKMAKNDLIGETEEENRLNIRQMIFAALFGNGTPM